MFACLGKHKFFNGNFVQYVYIFCVILCHIHIHNHTCITRYMLKSIYLHKLQFHLSYLVHFQMFVFISTIEYMFKMPSQFRTSPIA